MFVSCMLLQSNFVKVNFDYVSELTSRKIFQFKFTVANFILLYEKRINYFFNMSMQLTDFTKTSQEMDRVLFSREKMQNIK